MELTEHNEMAVAIESPSLYRLTLVIVTGENGEMLSVRLVL